jgi:hypothetical protein
VFSCDYNGWADVPEEEREGIDAFEAAGPPSPAAISPLTTDRTQRLLPVRWKEVPGSQPGERGRRAA